MSACFTLTAATKNLQVTLMRTGGGGSGEGEKEEERGRGEGERKEKKGGGGGKEGGRKEKEGGGEGGGKEGERKGKGGRRGGRRERSREEREGASIRTGRKVTINDGTILSRDPLNKLTDLEHPIPREGDHTIPLLHASIATLQSLLAESKGRQSLIMLDLVVRKEESQTEVKQEVRQKMECEISLTPQECPQHLTLSS